jgi:hypothetical protein
MAGLVRIHELNGVLRPSSGGGFNEYFLLPYLLVSIAASMTTFSFGGIE